MCIAAYGNQLADTQRFDVYPAKKRRPSYSEGYMMSKDTDRSASPAQSEDSQESSSYNYVLPSETCKPTTSHRREQTVDYVPKLVLGINMPENGWFSKCRGCGCMTAQEFEASEVCIPLCSRCQIKVHSLATERQSRMVANLSYVHTCWSDMGL